MSTYKLDETPDTFISGVIKEGSYIFRMNHIEEESNNKYLREIDLRKDKLIVYGTEINESNREKLHSSLIFRPDVGKLCVNCNGACYIYINKLSVYYRLIDNVVFDWSLFGVTVPNSVVDLLKKQQQQKEDEIAANKQEIEELKKDKKAEIESYKEEVNDLRNQLISSKKDNKYLEVELQMVQRQLSTTVFELLETSKILERVAKLEEQQGKVRNMEDRFSLIEKELQSTKIEQESMKKSVEGLDSLISSCKKENEDLFARLQKVQNQKSSSNKNINCEKVQDHITVIMNELHSIKNLMGFAAEMEVELEN